MITPAQYWISGGRVGGGLGESSSDELGRKVNLSTREKTFVIRGVPLPGVVEVLADDGIAVAFSFSFPRPVAVAKALRKGLLLSLVVVCVMVLELGDEVDAVVASTRLGPAYFTSEGC